MKKQILLTLLTLIPMMASAFTGELLIDDIRYYIKTESNYAEVTEREPKYSGDVVIPETVECYGVTCDVVAIGGHAFQWCKSLTSVTIPKSVKSISSYAFYGCTSLTSVTIPNSVTSIGNCAFYYCISLTSVAIPNSVTYIGVYAFEYCTSLTSVTIPNSVTWIDRSAFFECTSLTSVTIGNGIQFINHGAFTNCSSLTHFYCHAANVPRTEYNVFYGTPIYAATLHVPDESFDLYSSATPWCQFGNIVGLSETSINSIESENAEPSEIYSMDGQRRTATSKGINIVKMSDGTVKKVIIK